LLLLPWLLAVKKKKPLPLLLKHLLLHLQPLLPHLQPLLPHLPSHNFLWNKKTTSGWFFFACVLGFDSAKPQNTT
jgi:hypothetical protein